MAGFWSELTLPASFNFEIISPQGAFPSVITFQSLLSGSEQVRQIKERRIKIKIYFEQYLLFLAMWVNSPNHLALRKK